MRLASAAWSCEPVVEPVEGRSGGLVIGYWTTRVLKAIGVFLGGRLVDGASGGGAAVFFGE